MKSMLSVILIAIMLACRTNSCRDRAPMPNFQNSMTFNVPWYAYYMEIGYPWQQVGDRCTFLELVPSPNDPLKQNLIFKFITKSGQRVDANVYANESSSDMGEFSGYGSLDGINIKYSGAYLCGELGMVKGKMVAYESCNHATGENALWIGFDHRRTPSTITEAEKSTLAACLKKINVSESSLTLVDNTNCPPDF